jgi:hypothetical protein
VCIQTLCNHRLVNEKLLLSQKKKKTTSFIILLHKKGSSMHKIICSEVKMYPEPLFNFLKNPHSMPNLFLSESINLKT